MKREAAYIKHNLPLLSRLDLGIIL